MQSQASFMKRSEELEWGHRASDRQTRHRIHGVISDFTFISYQSWPDRDSINLVTPSAWTSGPDPICNFETNSNTIASQNRIPGHSIAR